MRTLTLDFAPKSPSRTSHSLRVYAKLQAANSSAGLRHLGMVPHLAAHRLAKMV